MAATEEPGRFGLLLRQHRMAAGLSQEELAERAGLSRRGISDLERGARRAPHPATVRRLAEALDLDEAQRAALLSSAHATTIQAVPSFAELLLNYRLKARLTQDGLAARAGLSARAISDLERGVRRFPYADTLQRLVDALGLSDSDRALLEAAAVRLDLPRKAEPHRLASGVRGIARHNLPVQLTSFVGRVQEIADVRHEHARTRLLTLTGPGGVGKTRLALRVAAEELDAFADGVPFVDLAPLTEATLVPQSVASLFFRILGPSYGSILPNSWRCLLPSMQCETDEPRRARDVGHAAGQTPPE